MRLLLPLLLAASASAATFTWDGGSSFNLWAFGDNWVGNIAPSPAQLDSDIVFAGSTRLSPFLDFDRTIVSLAFAANAGGFNLTSDDKTLTLGAGGLTQGSATAQTISHALALGAAQTWSTAAGALTVGGNVSLGAHALTLSGAGGTTLGGIVSGTGGLTLAGGTHTLGGTGANTFTGTTIVQAGTLVLGKTAGVAAIAGDLAIVGGASARLGAADQIPDTAAVSLGNGGAFDLDGNNETIGSLVVSGSSVATGAGTLTVSSGITITGGSISGSISLPDGSNVATLPSATTATISGTIDSQGTPHIFGVADGAAEIDLDVAGAFTNGGTIDKQGQGVLRLRIPTLNGSLILKQGTTAIASDLTAADVFFVGGAIRADGAPRTITPRSASPLPLVSAPVIVSGDHDITVGGSFVVTGSLTFLIENTGVTTFSGELSGNAFIDKLGVGTLVLTGANTFSGGLTIGSGVVRIANTTGSGSGTGGIAVSSRLEGTGSLDGVVNFSTPNGTLAPGNDNDAGRLTCGKLDMSDGNGRLEIGLAGTTPVSLYDQLAVRDTTAAFSDGTVTLGGTLSLSLLGGFDPADGAVFYILDNDGTDAISGTFANVTGAPNPLAPGLATIFAGGQQFAVSYAADWTGDPGTSAITGGNDIALIAVPEPGSAALLAVGMCALLARRRRG